MPCFVETILKLDEAAKLTEKSVSSRKGPVFLMAWDDLSLSKVHVRGVVIGCSPIGSTGYQLSLDDGSGRISLVLWTSTDEGSASHPPVEKLYNRFVAVQGSLIGFRSSVQIRIDSISVVATEEEPTEECLWWLHVREEWERLAALARKSALGETESQICPCLCHSGSAVACRTLGEASAWPHTFVRAVAVVSSALRTAAATSPLSLSLLETVQLVKSNLPFSPSLQTMKCLSDCATVAAVRTLTRTKFIQQQLGGQFIIHSSPTEETVKPASPTDEPRYPQTPADFSSQLTDSFSPKNNFSSKPLFFAI